jgi:hypothetical protein
MDMWFIEKCENVDQARRAFETAAKGYEDEN